MTEPRHTLPYRCAVYFAPPPDSAWGQAGSQWLGRCAATGKEMDLPWIAGLDAQTHANTIADPRRYGWHATLKAPFALLAGHDMSSVLSSMRRLASEHAPFTLPALQVGQMGSFLALRPGSDRVELKTIAAACVTQLQHLALPLSEAELARRRLAHLTPEQEDLLQQWGYPWVLDHFRFHFSLTGGLDLLSRAQRDAIEDAARRHFEGLGPCRFDRLSLFIEPEKGADFQLVEQLELRG